MLAAHLGRKTKGHTQKITILLVCSEPPHTHALVTLFFHTGSTNSVAQFAFCLSDYRHSELSLSEFLLFRRNRCLIMRVSFRTVHWNFHHHNPIAPFSFICIVNFCVLETASAILLGRVGHMQYNIEKETCKSPRHVSFSNHVVTLTGQYRRNKEYVYLTCFFVLRL